MSEITITLTIDETNLILESLGEIPFVRVHQLIGKIQQEAQIQLQAAQETKQVLDTATVNDNLKENV